MSSLAEERRQRSWQNNNSPELLLAAALTGTLSGLICVLFRLALRLLQWLVTGHAGLLADAAGQLPLWRRFATPILGAVAATLMVKAGRAVLGPRKSVDYVEAVRFRQGRIPFRATASKALASAFSIASGAAIGREGSMIQFAAASIAALGKRWKARPANLDRLVALGIAAAVAAVYQAPLAGIFFTLEIVFGLRVFSRAALTEIPALSISAGAGAWMSHLFLGNGPIFRAPPGLHFAWHASLPILASAVILGGLGPAYFYSVEALRWLKKLPWPMVWSGAVVGLFSCIRPETWGNGDSGVLQVLSGKQNLEAVAILLVLRLGATSACVGSGVAGGVFTPTIFAGSVLGLFYASGIHALLGGNATPSGYAVLGIACLLASVTHAPLMSAFMTVELTGTWECLPPVLFATFVSFLTARLISHDSLYKVATPDPMGIAETNTP